MKFNNRYKIRIVVLYINYNDSCSYYYSLGTYTNPNFLIQADILGGILETIYKLVSLCLQYLCIHHDGYEEELDTAIFMSHLKLSVVLIVVNLNIQCKEV